MAKICLVSPHHPANNPRLVRNAQALAEAGHDVVAVTPRFDPRWAALEAGLMAAARWRLEVADFLSPAARARWNWARLRRRLCFALAQRLPLRPLAWRALPYGFAELLQLAKSERADVYLAQSHPALPIAGIAARQARASLAFDAEDLLAESPAEPRTLHDLVERTFLPHCALVLTMSEAAADYLHEKHRLKVRPLVLHNVPALADRAGLRPPAERGTNECPSVYWFGQTIARASRADQVIRAMPLVNRRFKLCLRGNPAENFVTGLRELAGSLDCADRLELLPVAPPAELVRVAGEHDMMFGAQPGQEAYTQRAIGNKVMVGLMAGLGVLLTDTIAHRRLLQDCPGVGECFPDTDERGLAAVLNRWLDDRQTLAGYQERAWRSAGARLNWETESRSFVSGVNAIMERIVPKEAGRG